MATAQSQHTAPPGKRQIFHSHQSVLPQYPDPSQGDCPIEGASLSSSVTFFFCNHRTEIKCSVDAAAHTLTHSGGHVFIPP